MKNRSQKPEARSRQTETAPVKKTAPLLILISAPSGGGKTTLCEMLTVYVPVPPAPVPRAVMVVPTVMFPVVSEMV